MHGHGKWSTEYHIWMQNINFTQTYNMFNSLLSKTVHPALNQLANISNSTAYQQKLST